MNSPPDIDYAMVDGESIVWVSILECVVILGCAAGVAYCLFCVKCSSYGPQRQVNSDLPVGVYSNVSRPVARGYHELVPTIVQPDMAQGLEGSGQQVRDTNNVNSIFDRPVLRQLYHWRTEDNQQGLYGGNVWV